MRYLVQLLIPILIFAGVAYVLMRSRRQDSGESGDEVSGPGSDTGPFLVILIVSAAVALGAAYVLQSMWE